MGNVKWAVICARQAHDHLTGRRRSHELASLGRRICEPEWDLLELMPMTQDRPDAAELLDAVAEFLFTEVREWVPREQRFQVLVAANLCAVLARELRAGDEPLREDLALLRELLEAEPPTAGRRTPSFATRCAPRRPSSPDGFGPASWTTSLDESPSRLRRARPPQAGRSPARATPTERSGLRALSVPAGQREGVQRARRRRSRSPRPVM